MARISIIGGPVLLFIALAFAIPSQADSVVKVRLISGGAGGEVDGTATLKGQNLHGHLTGNGSDIELTGVVKNRTVSVELTGRIAPTCGLVRQSMSGTGNNEQEATSIPMSLECLGHALGYNGGENYDYHLDLTLPPHNLHLTWPDNPGESASLQ